ncbi:MAG: type II toxin-antitoxin system RelE/ParE family toxin [Gemmatimonadales bacterium]
MVQVRFRTRQLQRCYESIADATREWGAEVARRYVERVSILHTVDSIEDLHRITPFRFHPLRGDHRGQYALRLTDRARLIVTFVQRTTLTVRVEEVSKHYGD